MAPLSATGAAHIRKIQQIRQVFSQKCLPSIERPIELYRNSHPCAFVTIQRNA